MHLTRHSLQPFSPSPKDVGCSCALQRTDGVLLLDFKLTGELENLVIPTEVNQPLRKDELWQSTCFECFFKNAGNKNYWELNISPAGDWNLYRFSDYRKDMQPEERVTAVQAKRTQIENELSLQCSFSIKDLICQDDHLQLGLCCVLERTDGTKGYHALRHPGRQPDFHHQDGFLITLSPCS